ncbi:MAG: hypothetical protein G3M70_16495 [Candidatus Nitronauta litoralis]|uniref:Uncharacterized protein n=1 Tax=Candidatus Nitronauta litoralis TaxID=2705533 RepID=A0A7T0BYS5_9BACT|nr:MAG: hypothetical protein G3M70_16495 [Candidatus Nitronauta litoralis]
MFATRKYIILIFLAALGTLSLLGEAIAFNLSLQIGQLNIGQVATGECQAPPPSIERFQTMSTGGLIGGFLMVFLGIILDSKKIKAVCWALAVIPFGVWGYANFLVDYDQIKKTIFNLDIRAEQTLSNIAEAQDRFKSEQDEYIKDLSKVKSHLAGAHGLDECVDILELNVSYEHWDASARHVSSPNIVKWDSTSGSSMKKG